MDQVLIIVGDASETVDTLYPYYRLQEEGFVPVVAAPEKRRYQMVLHEVKPGWTITKEWEGYTIDADVEFRGGLRQGAADGDGGEVQVRPGGLRRRLRQRGLRHRRQPGQRPDLPRQRQV